MFCGNCGEKMQDGAKFCGKCGWKVEAAAAPVQDAVEEKAAEVQDTVEEKAAEVQEAVEEKVAEVQAGTEEKVAEVKAEAEEKVAEVQAVAEEVAAAAAVVQAAEEEKAPAEEPVVAAAPVQEPVAEEAPKAKKKKGLWILIPVILLALAGIAVAVVLFLGSLKREEVDLSDAVTFTVTGYSGYGVAEVVLNEEALEEKYDDLISEHTKIRWSKFMEEVDLLEYEVTELTGLSNGDKIILTWEYDKEQAAEEYKVDILCESIEYTVTGLTEVKKVDPFEDFTVTFDGVSGDGYANIDVEGYPDYRNYFNYEVSNRYSLSNGDTVEITFDVSKYKDFVAEQFGYELYPTKKSYTVEGLTEYVWADEQITEATVKPMLAAAEKHIYDHINQYWDEESSVKKLACVGHFISRPDSMDDSVKNIIGLIYKVNANVFVEERNLEVEYYFPVLFKNVVLGEDGAFVFQESNISHTGERFYKEFEPENEEDTVPNGTWYFYGYETLDGLKEDYEVHSVSWTTVETENFVEKNYTEAVSAEITKAFTESLKKVEEGNPETLIADAIEAFLTASNGWQETAGISGIKCVETRLYSSDVISETVPMNCFDVILQVTATIEYEDMFEEFPFYYVVRYPDVTVGTDGMLTADLTARTTANGQFTKMLGDKEVYTGWFSPAVNVWVYEGYQTMEELAAANQETRAKRVFYVLHTTKAYEVEAATDMNAWAKADDTAVVAIAMAAFSETTADWPESAKVSGVECVDTYLISCDVPTKANELAVLLKVTAEVTYEENTEAFDYYYMVRFGNAALDADGAISFDVATMVLTDNPFTKMLGDEEVPGAEGESALNVWNFSGYATAEDAEATVLAKRENHINYTGVKVPEPVVEEEPTETPEGEGEVPAEGEEPTEEPTTEGEEPTEEPKTEGEESAEEPKAEASEDGTYSLELTEVGEEKPKVIKVIREISGLDLEAAKNLVDAAPSIVKEGLTKEDAENLKARLEATGAKVTIK